MFVKKLSNREKELNRKNGIGTLAVEGIVPSDEAKKINNLFLNGTISNLEAIERIKIFYLGGKYNG